ncbi:deaminase [Stakelama pacifica]|uniref:Deoxycytidylate deaminase n=2 Tax=Stakelama pacifica TaxID=517720 RepID=A0A4R6F9I2_9SPHN|nr:deaminase [Stakelama pacifica]TDN77703.1 deoxycytidylate deaminase [Stakelama pacifica]
MYHAHGARMRSSCLSRQVGAALLDQKGNILATGTNEVPRAGGGVYGGAFEGFSDNDPEPSQDHRCHIHKRHCSNTREQNSIIDELIDSIDELPKEENEQLRSKIRRTRLGQLIEFSRAVHAEMDALLSAAREGVSTIGSRLYVTTYPCHNCARHIVAAGVDEVQFIEPYLKSKALPLHGDSITDSAVEWFPPSTFSSLPEEKRKGRSPQVLFRPFKGVAPRLYRRAFLKDRDLKNGETGDMLDNIPGPEGDSVPQILQASYTQIEATLAVQNQS